MSSNSNQKPEATIEPPILPKRAKRRSSLFDIETSETAHSTSDSPEQFLPSGYGARLKEEFAEWKATYVKLKAECLEKKAEAEGVKPEIVRSSTVDLCGRFLKEAEDFCMQVNIATEMHQIQINKRDFLKKELELKMEATKKKVCEDINL